MTRTWTVSPATSDGSVDDLRTSLSQEEMLDLLARLVKGVDLPDALRDITSDDVPDRIAA